MLPLFQLFLKPRLKIRASTDDVEKAAPRPLRSDVRPLLPIRPKAGLRGGVIVEARTGPFIALRSRLTLVALDLENIDRSATDIGRAIEYAQLAQVLKQGIGQNAHLIAVYSYAAGEEATERHLRRAGWATYARQIETIRTSTGVQRHANADVAFATAVGAAAIALNVEACVLATGDGQLAIDIARCLRSIAPRCRTFATLSLPGSTSRRLDSRRSDVFAVNIEVGDDVMRTLPPGTAYPQASAKRAGALSITSH